MIVEEPVFITLRDGTLLAAKLWRPDGPPVPAVLEYLPYRFRDGTRGRDQAMHGWIAEQGYACLRVDIRGMGESQGLLHDEYSAQELADGVEVIAWIAAQDWCDGQVAMMGISWSGFNALQIAALRPPALKTVIPVGFTDDRYATDVHYIGGLISKDNFDWSATMLAQNDLPPDPATFGPGWRAEWLKRAEANVPWAHHWFAHQRRDAYWQHGSVCQDYAAIQVPVYAVSGWADNYAEAVPRLLAGLKVPARGLIGPWAHSYPHDVTVGPAIGWLQEVIRWLDHWLKGRDTGIMEEPFLRVWMQEPLPPATCYTHRPGRWVGEDHWPSPHIRDLTFALEGESLRPLPAEETAPPLAGGAAAPLSPPAAPANAGASTPGPTGSAPSSPSAAQPRSILSPLWVGLTAGEIGRYGEDADWPPDQRMDDGGSLVWLSPPLTERLEIMGAPKVTLHLSADKPQAQVCLRLNDVSPDGPRARVTVGLLNLTHRNSHETPEPLTPGQVYAVTVELDDIAQAFPEGHRIGLSLSTSYYPIAHPGPEPARVTIHGGTLHLPERPPRPQTLRDFDAPVSAPRTPERHEEVPTVPRRVTLDLLSGRYAVDFPRWTYRLVMEDIATTVTSEGHVRHEITEGDPLSALTTTEYRVTIDRHGILAGHHSKGRLSCDATHFRLETQLTVTENGQTIFERQWDERFARDFQ
ncbi:CocE/NonD family hydrolase [Stagnihabitans tardus]|uniref:CocE/NonD family hydrolase n=1 Tax=Stagnihabitans tardus TaxID=2699202 RepID=A0AAE5BVE8_9RHOB|nr:CocE/NonD family hydrolase [Stagnihabitans tardus]NBZ87754.1 CocE/NonD family hydrolase [Stagnihabitans tardus]